MFCRQHVLIWTCPAGQHVRMTIHGTFVCSHSHSLLSFSSNSFERDSPPTPTCTLAHIQKEDGPIHKQESSHVYCPFFHLMIPLTQGFTLLSSSLPVCCLVLPQRPASFVACIYLQEERTGGRYRKHLAPACRTFLPSLGIFHIRAQTSALF